MVAAELPPLIALMDDSSNRLRDGVLALAVPPHVANMTWRW